jgi:uncharacterized membrane protein (UPF0127 family)
MASTVDTGLGEGAVRVADLDGRVVCGRCLVADRPVTRLRGLLGRSELPAGDGLLLRPAPSVHTWFMRFPIDVVFLDRRLEVLDVRSEVRPWRVAGRRGARAVLELAAGEARRRDIRPGRRLQLVPIPHTRDGRHDG